MENRHREGGRRSFGRRPRQLLLRAIGQIGNHVDSLRERIRLLEAVIENFPGGISLFDSELQMVLCNEQQKSCWTIPTISSPMAFRRSKSCSGSMPCAANMAPAISRADCAGAWRWCASEKRMSTSGRGRTAPSLEVRGTPIEGGGFVTTYLDVTEQRRTQALIAHMAHHDTLTNLPNRVLFTDRLQTAIALAKRSGLIAVHYLDIDRFKPVNDTLGHQAGDALLIGDRRPPQRHGARERHGRAARRRRVRDRPDRHPRILPTPQCWRAACWPAVEPVRGRRPCRAGRRLDRNRPRPDGRHHDRRYPESRPMRRSIAARQGAVAASVSTAIPRASRRLNRPAPRAASSPTGRW